MNQGQQVFPHKYTKRIKHNGKWMYIYAEPHVNTFKQATQGAVTHHIVQAQGKPTQILVDNNGFIVFGAPNIVGKQLLLNPGNKAYYGKAVDPTGQQQTNYLYSEVSLKKSASKKAAKFLKSSRALELLGHHAERLMESPKEHNREYGLAMWLNNNTQMRIGAHEDAASVDPKERAQIILSAKKDNWGPGMKEKALDQARKPTFGLLSLHLGHVNMEKSGGSKLTFNFMGKGGKENTYVVDAPPKIYSYFFTKKYIEHLPPETKLFPNVKYKQVWREYSKYGVTPHTVRGAFAEHMVKQLMQDFKVNSGESGYKAVQRFNEQLQHVVSEHLNHSRSMTERSYFSETTRNAVNEFREALKNKNMLTESAMSTYPGEALATAVLWLELGAGNTVV